MTRCTHRHWYPKGTMARCLTCGILFAPEDFRLPPPVDCDACAYQYGDHVGTPTCPSGA